MQKYIPWSVSAVLLAALVGTALYFRGVVESKDIEIQALRAEQAASAAEANLKLQAAGERVAAADAKAQEIAASAAAKVQEVSEQAAAVVQQVTTQANASAEAQAAEARERLRAASLPEAKAEITFRKAMLSNGSVAVIRNTSSAAVPFTIFVGRAATNQTRQVSAVIDAGRFAEIGEREGWAFLPGDTVRITHPGHKAREFTFR